MYKDVEGRSVKLEAMEKLIKIMSKLKIFFGKPWKEQPKRHQVIILVLFHHWPSLLTMICLKF